MKTVVEVPRIESLEGRPGYGSFTNDLQLVYNLGGMTPNELRWTEMKAPTTEFGVPDVILDPEGDAPQLSVGLYPVNEGSVVTGSHVYQAPLLLRGVDRWQSSPLRDYKVKHWRIH